MENNSSDNLFHFSTSLSVRFGDCDMLGHANHSKMFTYMEEARAKYFVEIMGIQFTSSQTNPDVSAIIAEATCNYQSPAKFNETLLVKTRVLKIGKSSFVMDYEITEEKTARAVATGKTVGVFFDYKINKSTPIPVEIREKIEKFEQKKF